MSQNTENYITTFQAAKIIGFSYAGSLPSVLEQTLLDNFSGESGLISKENVKEFLKNHISVIQLRDEVVEKCNIKVHSFETKYREMLEKIGVKLIFLSNRANYIYLSKDDYEKALEYYLKLSKHPDSNIFTKQEIIEILELSSDRKSMDEVLNTYNIEPYIQTGKGAFYHRNQVNELLEHQKKAVERMNDYISIDELTNGLGYNKSSVLAWLKRQEIKSIMPPFITKNKYKGSKKYILIKFANQYYEEVGFRQKLDETFEYYNVDFDPYITYKEVLKLYAYQFANFAPKTSEYWDMFAKEKLYESERRELRSFVHQFALLTGFIMNIVNHAGKELFLFSTKELNLSLLTDTVPYNYKIQYYSFINKIHQGIINSGGDSVFDMMNLRSPKKERKEKHLAKEKEIYKPEVFVDLLKYTADVEFHFRKAIHDAKKWSSKEYTYYANMWLYIVIQLTNAWRHSDVVDFPRFKDMYKDKDLDWLLKNPLSKEDARVITAYFENKVYIHHKNQQSRYLIVSEDLQKSFATAVLICEFIQREKNDANDKLFDFGNLYYQPSDSTHKAFFEEFSYKNLKIENRKMNWTVITLATDVISKITGRNPLEIAKFLRNHSTDEMTNIYIQLPQEYVDYISKQLFDLGSFGYIFDGMSQILLNEAPKPIQNENALMIKNSFGDVSVVEGISKHFNMLKKEKDYVLNQLKSIQKEEIKQNMDYLQFGLMPSKKEGYQCLVGGATNCPHKAMDCRNCSLNVPNRFALCSFSYDIEKAFDEVEQGFLETDLEAEKIRLSNKLFTQLSFLRTAIDRFGRDVVDQFIPGGLDRINKRLRQIPKTLSYVSAGVKNWLIEEGVNSKRV
ncbi:hypothetical protein J7E55_21610 [Bacillus sp. ISL-53]|nr:hypothetical protein [Bacillus sp. ISL-53]